MRYAIEEREWTRCGWRRARAPEREFADLELAMSTLTGMASLVPSVRRLVLVDRDNHVGGR